MAKVYEFNGLVPVIHPTAFVHADAVLIGDAVVGADCYVAPGASLRGDFGRVELGPGANLQDNCVMHSYPGKSCSVGANGHIGHGAILHGCVIADNAMVGMGAVIMDGATVGEWAVVAALSFVKAGETVPPGMLMAGIPARIVRQLDAAARERKRLGTQTYQLLARQSLATLKPAQPLEAEEPDRPRLSADVFDSE